MASTQRCTLLILGLGMLLCAEAKMTKADHIRMFDEYAAKTVLEKKPCYANEEFKCRYQGFILPLWKEAEMDWPNWLRVILYLIGLAWTFLGVGIISEVFMGGIEKVTSWKKRLKDKKTGRTVTVYLWNATVANLTLMALGSSAPEILLSLIEICVMSDPPFFIGGLGAGTIIGSAAFNLLCISAVCIMAIPEPEVRYIKQTTVYGITATCSVLAYVWLLFILVVISPNVCEVWEAALTLAFCPLLVLLAFAADKGLFDRTATGGPCLTIPDDVTPDEVAMIEQQIREAYGCDLSHDHIVKIMLGTYFTRRSRAYYRQLAMREKRAGKNRLSKAMFDTIVPQIEHLTKPLGCPIGAHDSMESEKLERCAVVGFETARYAFLENCGTATLWLVRTGPTHCKATVRYETRQGTATAVEDYVPVEDTMVFEKGETKKPLHITVCDDKAHEDNEEFYVDLSEPTVDDTNCEAKLSTISTAMIIIIDDDDAEILRFQKEEVEVEEQVEQTFAEIHVDRVGGASGTVSCQYQTEDMSAVAGMDYEKTSGRLEFRPSVQSVVLQVPIKPVGRCEGTVDFIVRLSDPTGGEFDPDTDGGEDSCVCHVTIKGNQGDKRMTLLKHMTKKIHSQRAIVASKNWVDQFYTAVFVVVEDDDDDDPNGEGTHANISDYFFHIVSLPWKLLFACVPPVDYCGGWVCFCGALLMLAVVTAIVGDMANLVGCCLGMHPEVTAITFVALGTSLPDTYASKLAASMDPHADASIGNITGSNSVNVFIGLGLSWLIASTYWAREPTTEWLNRVALPGGMYYDVREDVANVMQDGNAVFVVPAVSLPFNLAVFVGNAFFAIQHLLARRKMFGGELGGPRRGFMGQYFSACFLVGQWVIYVTASSIYAVASSKGDDC